MNYNIDNLNGEMLGRACAFAGKGDVRFYLNSVYIEKRPAGGVYIVATNGHYLCVYEDKEALPEEGFKEAILDVYQPNSKRLLPVFAQMKKTDAERVDLLNLDNAENQTYVVRTVEDEAVAHRVNVHDGHYPNWKRVITKGFSIEETVTFNVRYLAKLKDFVLKNENKKFPSVVLVSSGSVSSSVFQSEHGLVVIMPMHISSNFVINELVKPEEIELEEVAQ